jgi:hypothetical protein
MTTIIIESKSKAAKDLIDYLKKQPFVKVIEDLEPSESLKRSIEEAKTGKVNMTDSVSDLLDKLKK